MKKSIWIPLLAGWGLCYAHFSASAQEYKEHISKQFTLQKPASGSVLAVYNIFGSVKVEGYSGDKVLIEVDETISGDDAAVVETGKKEFKLGFDQTADSLIAYTAAPYDTRPRHNTHYDHDDHHQEYVVKLAYTIKVPNNINLRISTVNNGALDIQDVYGALKITNVNGSISIANAKGATEARTVNGSLTVSYLSVPTEASSYYTLNGKLTATYPKTLAADLQFKSMNGEFYTDFDNTAVLPSEVVKTESKKANGTTYKLNKNTQMRIGAGGKLFKFETLNGNIYIKKQS